MSGCWPSLAGVLYAPVVAVDLIAAHPHLTALNWLFMAGTGVLQTGYFVFLQHGYRLGDLSVVYPIGRGSGALLSALAGIVLLGERPGPVGIAGIVCIVAGVIVLGLPEPRRDPPPAGRAAPAAAPASAPGRPSPRLRPPVPPGRPPCAPRRGSRSAWPGRRRVHRGLHAVGQARGQHAAHARAAAGLRRVPGDDRRAGPVRVARPGRDAAWCGGVTGSSCWVAAVLAPLAYILVLTALAFSSVAAIAPAREVSVLFGVILGGRLLGEGSLARRLAAAAAVVAGIIAIAIG